MTDREILELLVSKMDAMENRMGSMENRMDSMESKIDSLESKIGSMESKIGSMESKMDTMQSDIEALKKTAYLVETDIAPKVQLLLENHTDLAKNVMVAKDVEERVGVLEFDVKMIKKMLQAKAGA